MPAWILIVIIITALILVIGCVFILAYILSLVISINKEIKEVKTRLLKEE